VDGGSSLLAAADGKYGRITLNNISCQQRTTGSATWLKTYWNCAHLDTTDADELLVPTAINGLPAGFIATLSNNDTDVYIMSIGGDYNYFFQPASWIPNTVGTSNAAKKIAAVFEITGSGVDYRPYLRGNIMHELGHLIDQYNGILSKQVGFTGPDSTDIGNMTAQTCATVFSHPAFCAAYPTALNAWDTYNQAFIGGQDVDYELFAASFQMCSGFRLHNADWDHVQRTPTPATGYLGNVWTYQNGFWSGGCRVLAP